jgi:hypothetical protein
MMIWGGAGSAGLTNTGGLYNPANDMWTPIPSNGAPSGRVGATMLATGTGVIVWGGDDGNAPQNDGAFFNATNNQWTTINSAGAPSGRAGNAGVWSGAEMIIWGGNDGNGPLSDGASYNLGSDSWQPISGDGIAPGPRANMAAVYTDDDAMLIWGGEDGSSFFQQAHMLDPGFQAGGFWFAAVPENLPSARARHESFWTGEGLFIWGGCGGFSCNTKFGTGAYWVINAPTWTTLEESDLLGKRQQTAAVWTGTEAIIWGGKIGQDAVGTGARRTLP